MEINASPRLQREQESFRSPTSISFSSLNSGLMPKRSRNVVEPRRSSRLRELENRRNDRSEGKCIRGLSNRRNDRSEAESLCGLSNRRNDRSEGERTGNDRSKGERTGNDISEGERIGNDRSEGERMGNDRSEEECTGNDRSEGERLRELSNSRNSRSEGECLRGLSDRRNARSEGECMGNGISEGERMGNDIVEGEHTETTDRRENARGTTDQREKSSGERLRGPSERRNNRSEGERLRELSNRRNSRSEGKLNSINFDCYLENIWRKLPEDKKNSFTCLDSIWFSSHRNKQYESKVLRWIKNKDIFSKKYVFVPIVLWGHWCLLIFCHLGESLESESTTPCMLLLDSLQIADSSRFVPEIRKFVSSIFNNEERPESKQLIKKIPLLVPQVPQQRNATDCGKFVLFYISLFLENALETFSISGGYPYFMKEDWFTHDQLESFWQDLQTLNKNTHHLLMETPQIQMMLYV
ncbi:hypothetical protein H5410_058599 [Solanum commersonii]|uniref:Ubiquitin-like protease family profile domain-containing protein n=1 Tax=Solanum commersonii TaxID=4109 RepID=A0A9J5WRJ8_SOLCO|nr:hypothetical protein H5410_058599 [Solanum commersonii]